LNSVPGTLLVILAAGLSAPIAVADYQSGVSAYARGELEQALAEWQKVIESPAADVDPSERAETFFAVAMLFWMGQGVTQDTAASADFLRQAAELNHPGAQSKLGYLFLIGQGVPANTFEATKWLQMAARQGDADAQYNLAVMYRDGIGVDTDPDLAIQWFREAAANGDSVSAEVVAEYQRQGVLQAAVEPALLSTGSDTRDEGQLPSEAGTMKAEEPELVPESGPGPSQQPEPLPLPKDESGPLPVPPEVSAETESEPPAGKAGMIEPHINGAYDEQWILTRDPARYTIQVIALKNLQSMGRLVDQHPQLQPFAVYLQGDPGSPLYVLVQGDYADINQVREVQKGLPGSLAKPEQTWVRRFGRVQELIGARQPAKGEITEISRGKD